MLFSQHVAVVERLAQVGSRGHTALHVVWLMAYGAVGFSLGERHGVFADSYCQLHDWICFKAPPLRLRRNFEF